MTTSSAVHSNAFNFMGFLEHCVDPRTGQYTVSVDIPELKTNHLCGPTIPLQLQFNPLNELDSGFGMGWNLNLSQFTPHNNMIALSTGENFCVTGSGEQPAIKEKKLDSFHFHNLGNDTYRVVHKSGLVETLVTGGSDDQRVALPREIRSPSGHAVTLTYTPFRGGQLLATISDAFTTLLRVERDPNHQFVKLHLHPDSGPDGEPLATFEMKLDGQAQVTRIILPTDEHASWRFFYEQKRGRTCLVEVQTPIGGRERIYYLDGGHVYPSDGVGLPRQPLPRVTRHRTDPGFEQPEIVVDYSYSLHNNHNFIGSGVNIPWLDDGLDNLYRAPVGYEYGSVATLMDGPEENAKEVRKVTRTYNRFHLMTEERTQQGDCIKIVSTEYHAQEVSFDCQPPQFQLPKTVTTRWALASDANQTRTEVESTAFDEFGNLTERVLANGIREASSYYPKEATPGCPADPERFVRNLKEKIVYPAESEHGSAPVLRTLNTYQALPALASASGASDWLVVTEETLTSSTDNHQAPLQHTQRIYNNEPANPALHGRPKSQTETFNQHTTTTEYEYSTPISRLAGQTVDQTVETLTGFDGSTKNVTLQYSLLNGEVLLDHDNDSDVKISYVYDVLERVTLETVAPDSDFAASRAYRYALTAEPGEQASQEVVDVKGVVTRTKVDGLNRPILEERQDADSTTPARYRRTYAATHDLFGNIVLQTDYDWLGATELALRRIFEFDDWGEQLCVTGPDQVTEYSQTDPFGDADHDGPITRSWRQGPAAPGGAYVLGAMTETRLTLFDKPARVERFDADGETISVHHYFYDGLGRTAREVDARNYATLYVYDAFDRMIETTLPGGDVVRRRYAEHTDEDLPSGISVNDIELGTQVFDGLGRKTQSIIGGRQQVFSYDPGQSRPKTVTTPSGREISYEYQPALGDEPQRRSLAGGSVTAQYDYDKANARLLKCFEADQELERSWFSTGELKSESRRQGGGEKLSMNYLYSLNGRLLQYTDVLGQTQYYYHDKAGRLEGTELGLISSTFTYNDLGWLSSISTTEQERSVTTTLYYDDLGREINRVFDLNGVSQTLSQTYNGVDAVKQRTLKEGETLLRDETYEYDPRGRLVLYTCTGTQRPVDPYGQVISEQAFRFDALDNITRVLTVSTSGENLAIYSYDGLDPVQLQKVTNSDIARYPGEILLEYDADGNLTLDEQQRSLTYDDLGRLMSVSAGGDGPSTYRYDPLDRVASGGPLSNEPQRFYADGQLANLLEGATTRTFIRGADQLLAERRNGSDASPVLLATDSKQSVSSEIAAGQSPNDIAYSAYGQRTASNPIVGALSFNGQLAEPSTGWQLLGNGYRAFNPVLMRFNSPDDLSPFGEGGLNGYAYCHGDPVNRSDPTGHSGIALFGFVLFVAGATLVGVGSTVVENPTYRALMQIAGGVLMFGGLLITGAGVGLGNRSSYNGRGVFGARPPSVSPISSSAGLAGEQRFVSKLASSGRSRYQANTVSSNSNTSPAGVPRQWAANKAAQASPSEVRRPLGRRQKTN